MTRGVVAAAIGAIVAGCATSPGDNSEAIGTLVTAGVLEAIPSRQPNVDAPPALVTATPDTVDFGSGDIGTLRLASVTLSNPTDIDLTLIGASFSQPCFALNDPSSLPLEVPAHGDVPLALVFRPRAPGPCAGLMVLEFDAAGRRFREVTLRAVATPA